MSAKMKVKNFFEQIQAAQPDPTVGIRIIQVTGHNAMGLYVAELAPYQSISAHYHRAGSEIYQIVQGEGQIYTGVPLTGDRVSWKTSVGVHRGDCFTVEEGRVHHLENTGSLPLIVIIICPASHITTDQFIVQGTIPQ